MRYLKPPAGSLDYRVSFSHRQSPREVITAVTWATDDESLTLVPGAVGRDFATVRISGGTDGRTSIVRCGAETSAGNHYWGSLTISIVKR